MGEGVLWELKDAPEQRTVGARGWGGAGQPLFMGAMLEGWKCPSGHGQSRRGSAEAQGWQALGYMGD